VASSASRRLPEAIKASTRSGQTLGSLSNAQARIDAARSKFPRLSWKLVGIEYWKADSD
jgi:hypothetical protein